MKPPLILARLNHQNPRPESPWRQIPATVTLGGGYYFIPPIPNKRISDLSEQFFS